AHRVVREAFVGAGEAEPGEGLLPILRVHVGRRGLAVGVDGLPAVAGLGVEPADEEPRPPVIGAGAEVLAERLQRLLLLAERVEATGDREGPRRVGGRELPAALVAGERAGVVPA